MKMLEIRPDDFRAEKHNLGSHFGSSSWAGSTELNLGPRFTIGRRIRSKPLQSALGFVERFSRFGV